MEDNKNTTNTDVKNVDSKGGDGAGNNTALYPI